MKKKFLVVGLLAAAAAYAADTLLPRDLLDGKVNLLAGSCTITWQ